jgi:hypothetical protein
LVAFALALALAPGATPTRTAAAETSRNAQSSIGAQADFDTALYDDEGNPLPGSYVNAFIGVSRDSYLVDGMPIDSATLYATIVRYEVGDDGSVTPLSTLDGWTDAAAIVIDPSLKAASASGVLNLYSCGWNEEGPYCDLVGAAELSITFSGANPMHYEPMHYTEVSPGPGGYVYNFHRTATLRYATGQATLDGVSLGISAQGNFFRTHEGEHFVSR